MSLVPKWDFFSWDATLDVILFKNKNYTLYKLDSSGYPVNVAAKVTLFKEDGTTQVKVIKSSYDGFFGLVFSTSDLEIEGNYIIKLEFTAAQTSDYDKRFMLVDKYVTIDYQQTYDYDEFVEIYSITIPNNYVQEDNLTQNRFIISTLISTTSLFLFPTVFLCGRRGMKIRMRMRK